MVVQAGLILILLPHLPSAGILGVLPKDQWIIDCLVHQELALEATMRHSLSLLFNTEADEAQK